MPDILMYTPRASCRACGIELSMISCSPNNWDPEGSLWCSESSSGGGDKKDEAELSTANDPQSHTVFASMVFQAFNLREGVGNTISSGLSCHTQPSSLSFVNVCRPSLGSPSKPQPELLVAIHAPDTCVLSRTSSGYHAIISAFRMYIYIYGFHPTLAASP